MARRPQFSLKTLLVVTLVVGATCWAASWLAYATFETALYVAIVSAGAVSAMLAVIGWKG